MSFSCISCRRYHTCCGIVRSLTYYSLALAELYITIASLFRRKEFTLHETTWDRDVHIVRDCFIGEPSPESKGIRIKYAESSL